jgi:hypothetical protein
MEHGRNVGPGARQMSALLRAPAHTVLTPFGLDGQNLPREHVPETQK